MKRSRRGATWLGLGMSTVLTVTAVAQSERKLSINAVMHKQYTVSRAPYLVIKKELAGTKLDWKKVRDASKTFGTLAIALQKNRPPSGEADSWKKLTDEHLGTAKALAEAAEAKDKRALAEVHRKVAESCKACHAVHRSRGGG